MEVVGRRAGTALDPSIAEAFVRCGRELLTEIASSDASVAVIEAEPEPCRRVSEPRLEEVARAFADMIDLKSPFTHGQRPLSRSSPRLPQPISASRRTKSLACAGRAFCTTSVEPVFRTVSGTSRAR